MNDRTVFFKVSASVLVWLGATTVMAETAPVNSESVQTAAVFLRADSAVNGPAVNVYINGEYLTSLQPGQYQASEVLY